MTARTYATAASVLALRRRVTEPDWAVLADVATMRLARATDLEALAALRGDMPGRQFRRRLQRLYELDVLGRLERRIGGQRSGSSGWVYALGLAGQRLLDPGEVTSVRRPWTPRPTWLRHALAVGHLYPVLRQADARGRLQLHSFEPEPVCWRPFTDEDGPVTLKPDALARFDVDDITASVFVEVDCATESPNTLARKADVYRRYWLTDTEQEAHGVFPEVLWLVPSEARLRTMQRVIARQPDETEGLHRAELYDQALRAFLEPP
jgi:hypothetical protein